jgi:dTDP-4-dehydrorhamnose 3,5-epimerase
MLVTQTTIPEVLLLESEVFRDTRGFFFESFNTQKFKQATGLTHTFVQDNQSQSVKGVLRGLHYQIQYPQGKVVRVTRGEIFDVAVDLRRHAKTFGQWVGVYLNEHNKHQLWIPEGFAHGFLVLSEIADVLYKTTTYYKPQYERCILWNDATLNITWPLMQQYFALLSTKDNQGETFLQAEVFA